MAGPLPQAATIQQRATGQVQRRRPPSTVCYPHNFSFAPPGCLADLFFFPAAARKSYEKNEHFFLCLSLLSERVGVRP